MPGELVCRQLMRLAWFRLRIGHVMEDTNLVSLIERFGSEDRCREYLEELRWPNGTECPRCGDYTAISRIASRNQYECAACRYQFSVTAGTLLHDSHLPLWKWFLAIYLMCESKKGISAKQVQRMLKVSYKTAWYLCHRIRDAMGDGEQPLLTGTVEVDETIIGGKRKGFGKGYRGNKVVVAGAIERGGEIRLRLVPNNRRHNLECFIESSVDDDASIYTDELKSYEGIAGKDHQTVKHKDEEWVRGNVHTNTVESAWSLLKRSVVGTYHHMSIKHLPAYLDEMEWRFNNRDNPYLFRDTLLVLLHGDALPYTVLIERDDHGEHQRENDALMRREAKRQARRPC
jgi:transposase-like protein